MMSLWRPVIFNVLIKNILEMESLKGKKGLSCT